MKSRLRAISLAALALLPTPGAAAAAPAHDLERTQVLVSFRTDGSFQIDVRNAAIWMLERLEPFTGEPPSGRLQGEAQTRRLTELTPLFGRWVWIWFDGQRLELEPEYFPPDDADGRDPLALGTMRFTGTVPAGATTFSFAYGLVIDPYPMLLTARDGTTITHFVPGDLESDRFEIAAITAPSRLEVVRSYLRLGFTHILPKGLDHILFVIGIFLLSTRLRPILVQVTTFTLAHTITLGLTIFGVLSLPSAVVEPLIALSIAYVAVENLFTSELRPWRVALVFGFGLLHGMGFAGVLSGLGLPPSERIPALFSFNVGVELGQLAVIAGMLLAVGGFRERRWYRRRVVVPLSLAIAAVGLYWTVTRIVGA